MRLVFFRALWFRFAMRNGRVTLFLLLLVSFSAPWLGYGASLRNGYTYDDVIAVRDNDRVHDLSRAGEILRTEYWNKRELHSRLYRPLTLLSIAAESAVLGREPGHFHVVNLILHGAVSALVGLVVVSFLGEGAALAAGAAALLFALHPLHSEAVLPVVGRAELLAALFSVLALLGLAMARPIVASPAIFLGLLAKESAILAAPYALLRPWFDRGGPPLPRAARAGLWLVPGIVAIYLLRRVALSGVPAPIISYADNPMVGAPPLERLATGLAIMGRAFWMHVAPLRLSPDYSHAALPLVGFGSISAWFGVLIVAGLTGLAVRGGRGAAARGLAGFGALWFLLGALAISNLLVPIGTIFAERLTYLPGIGLFLMLAAAIHALPRRAAPYGAILVVLLSVASIPALLARTAAWKDNLSLFERATADQPRSFRVWCGYGEALMQSGKLDAAEAAFRRSLAIYDGFSATHNGLMSIGYDTGRRDLAATHATRLKRIVPTDPRPWFVLSELARQEGQLARAVALADSGLARHPEYLPLRLALARGEAALGRNGEAYAHYAAIIAAQPELTAARVEAGPLLLRLERWREGAEFYRALAAIQGDWSSRNSLAWCLLQEARQGGAHRAAALSEARSAAEAALADAPAEGRAHVSDTLGEVLWELGERDRALALFETLAQSYPDDARYRERLARLRAGR